MRTVRLFRLAAIVAVGVLAFPPGSSAEPILGDPPTAPKDVSGLPRGPRLQSVTGGFSVNTDSREEVRSFYNAVYTSSDGVPMNSTANTGTCTPGTNGTAYKEAVLRRINWFRAMAGMPASVTLDATNNSKDQEAALMMSRNNQLSHTPTNTWFCWTASGSSAANNSNLSLGSAGAEAISDYLQDPGANNALVGHRRWMLYPQTQVMGTGDVPQQGGYAEANALWVFDANLGGPRPATRTPYVAWPPAGYAPYPVVYPRWSFADPNASFTNATISMRSNGVSVAVAKEPYAAGFGENTVAWVPMGLNATNFNTLFPFGGADTVYTVAISNIAGAPQSFYVYTVTAFDPAVPGADYFPPVIAGPSQPVVGQSNAYTFTAVSNATSYQWRSALRTPYNLSDGAETGLGNFTANTTAGYSVQDSNVKAAGSYSFHLAHPDPPSDQVLELNQFFVPGSNALLTFKSRLGYAGTAQTAKVEVSNNDGVGWVDLYSQTGSGISGDPGETIFSNRSLSLASFTGSSLRLRFRYGIGNGSYYNQADPGVGWYLDDIVITNTELWTVTGTNTVATTNVAFNPTQAGTYSLDARALIFTEFPLDWGPAKTVNATTNVPPVIVLGKPAVTNGQVRLDFAVTAGAAATFKLLQADQLAWAWTTNGSAMLTTNVPGSSYRFTTTVGPAARFYRVKTP